MVTYQELFQTYAREAGLMKRLIIPVPVLSPRLSSLWIHLITPVPAALARPLTEGLSNKVVAKEGGIRDIVPQRLLTCQEAVRRALMRVEQGKVETCWHDAGQLNPPEWLHCGDAPYAGGAEFHSAFALSLDAPPDKVWPYMTGVGGRSGWYFGDAAWRLRGRADRLLGGPGLSRGRRQAGELRGGRRPGFLAGAGPGPAPAVVALGRDENPGPGGVGASGRARGRGGQPGHAHRPFPAPGISGHGLLEASGLGPCLAVRRHAQGSGRQDGSEDSARARAL